MFIFLIFVILLLLALTFFYLLPKKDFLILSNHEISNSSSTVLKWFEIQTSYLSITCSGEPVHGYMQLVLCIKNIFWFIIAFLLFIISGESTINSSLFEFVLWKLQYAPLISSKSKLVLFFNSPNTSWNIVTTDPISSPQFPRLSVCCGLYCCPYFSNFFSLIWLTEPFYRS